MRIADDAVVRHGLDAVRPHVAELLLRECTEIPGLEPVRAHTFRPDNHHQRRLRDIRVAADMIRIATRPGNRSPPCPDPAGRVRKGNHLHTGWHRLP